MDLQKNLTPRRKEFFSRNCTVVTPDGGLPVFIGGGDRLGGEGVPKTVRSEERVVMSMPCGVYLAPPHRYVVPSPL